VLLVYSKINQIKIKQKDMKQQIEDIVKANWEYDNVEVEKIAEQIIELYKPKWISVNNELPKENGIYLVFTDYGDLATIRTFSVELGFLDVHITHWMPLPNSPILTTED